MSIVHLEGALGAPPTPPAEGIYLWHDTSFNLRSTDQNGVTKVLESNYFKVQTIVTTAVPNFNSNVPTDVPGLVFEVPVGGDYVFYSSITANNDQNEELDMFFALGDGITQVAIADSVVYDRQQKGQDQSIQNTFAIDGLVAGDFVTVQLDTRGDNVDLEVRRLLVQKWT